MVMLSPKGMRESMPEYPDTQPSMPSEKESSEKEVSGDELGDTLNLDEDVDFF